MIAFYGFFLFKCSTNNTMKSLFMIIFHAFMFYVGMITCKRKCKLFLCFFLRGLVWCLLKLTKLADEHTANIIKGIKFLTHGILFLRILLYSVYWISFANFLLCIRIFYSKDLLSWKNCWNKPSLFLFFNAKKMKLLRNYLCKLKVSLIVHPQNPQINRNLT